MPIHGNAALSHGNAWLQSDIQPVPWLWDGLIAREAITLLSAPEKTGKTTLLALLLDRRREGGTLLGRTVHAGSTILCTEEHRRLWALRQPPLNFGSQLEYHRPMDEHFTLDGWRRYIDHLLGLEEGSFDLLVIDTVMSFLPAVQNNPKPLRTALNELRVVASFAGVLLLHQANTARSRSRARGPLGAFADILIDMQIPRNAPLTPGGRGAALLAPLAPCGRGVGGERYTTRRHFTGVGRYPGTMQHVAAELNPEGTDYLVLPDAPLEPALSPTLETVRQLLSQSPTPLTRQEILTRWPEDARPPHPDSLWRTLTHGCELGILVRTGAGTRAEAFRYGVAVSVEA